MALHSLSASSVTVRVVTYSLVRAGIKAFPASSQSISTCIFSSPSSVYFLRYLGEFVCKPRHFVFGDHCVYSHDLYV